MNLRYFVFRTLDFLKGSKINNDLKDIQYINENNKGYKDRIDVSLKNLMKHAVETVPYYKDLKYDSLKDFPIVNKVMMKNDIQSFLSTKELPLGKTRHTSGSTGIPFEIKQDIRKSNRIVAELIYFREKSGDKLGNKYINILSPSKADNLSKLNLIKQNLYIFDATKLNDENLEKFHKLLLEHKIKNVLSYASSLENIVKYFEKMGYVNDKYTLNSITSSSEMLSKDIKERLEKCFKCKVVDRYSNEDNGFIAQTDDDSFFLINRASYFIEILKMNSDEETEPNELGRVVITDLFNYAQPFIRYDTGDLATYDYKIINGEKTMVLSSLQGRRSDMLYDDNNCPISTFAVANIFMDKFNKIKQYQFIQNSKNDFILNIIDEEHNYSDNEYYNELGKIFGKSMKLDIHYINKIPTLSSGKFKRIICNYKGNE